jgi:hypothetical protein
MRQIVGVSPESNYHLRITFDDGDTAVIDVEPLLERDAFQALRNKSLFSEVEIDHKFSGVVWPNGVDICIDWIEEEIEDKDDS